MPLPVRLNGPASAPPAQQIRPAPSTPASVAGASKGQNYRPMQDVVQEVRQPDRGPALPWPELERKLPVRLGG